MQPEQSADSEVPHGKLKIFFGASAGVGKTYAMLSAARTQLLQGVDVILGVVETHGRMETDVMADGLERLPFKEVVFHGQSKKEFDLEGALARKPTLIVIDELAHANAPGSRHPKRWQDVEELLEAGIDVYSALNVQHLESLCDVVGGITGIRVWETVPDRVFDTADEVVLVDVPPDELLQRLKEGKIYLANQPERAIRNFFRKGNLIALRELALRRTADRVDNEMLSYRREQFVSPVWQTRDSLLACVGPGEAAEKIVRTAARIANRLDAPWHAIYVETPELQNLQEEKRHRILRNLKLAQDMGAQTATLTGNDSVEVAVRYARSHNLGTIAIGQSHPRYWCPWYRSFAWRVGKCAPDLDVMQVAHSEDEVESTPPPAEKGREHRKKDWPAYVKTVLVCCFAGLAATPLLPFLDLANIAMLFLLAVVLIGVLYGRGPAVLATLLNVVVFHYFFVPPRFSFALGDAQHLMTFAVMLVVGLITGQITAGFKYQAKVATRREQRMSSLYEMSRDLSAALMREQITEIGERFIAAEFSAKAAFILIDEVGKLQLAPLPSLIGTPKYDHSVAQWALDHGEAAGQGTDTLPASSILYLPLKAPMRIRGVLALELPDPERLLIPEQRRLLETFASLIAIALERVHYVEVAQDTTVQMESERLRNSLLAAISHDLRTPMSVMVGLADSMFLTQPPPTGPQAEIANSIREEALRVSSQVNNLLDMARLQAGRVELNRQWQPLEEVIGSALKSLERVMTDHTVKVSLEEDLPLAEIDFALMERVFCNLLENAIKYTPPGSNIEIGAKASARSIEVWVDDNGPGLPGGKEETIFKKFERGEREGTTSGVGLGLAICRAIVEAHGGDIHAENRRHGGARFYFTLPRGNPPSLANEEEHEIGE